MKGLASWSSPKQTRLEATNHELAAAGRRLRKKNGGAIKASGIQGRS